MIIDCHTHIWDVRAHLSKVFVDDYKAIYKSTGETLSALPAQHQKGVEGADRVVVVAFKSVALGINVPNDYVAKYCDKDPKRLIGFCCVDPNEAGAADELRKCIRDYHMRGLKLGPIYQNFDPSSEAASKIFEAAQELGIPVLMHQGTTFVRSAPLKFAYPSLLDDVAIKFKDLKIIIAHLGHPWEDETIAVIRKHPNVYADVSALSYRPFRFFDKLLVAFEYGVHDKLVFGSDFPFDTTANALSVLRDISRYSASENSLKRVPQEMIENIISNNAKKIFRD
ncbi:MAG: amidohydrolase family protein [Nitrososphaerales archaeon]